MQEQIKKVKEFSDVFEIKTNETPSLIKEKDYTLRYDLMYEENEEYLAACINDDIIEIADSLGDQLYVLIGTILSHGMQHKIVEVFNLIHQNNMNKLHDGVVVRDENGKIKKPDGFVGVNLTKIFNND
jgi:predicted HAD superfamily Cof-like phosphohydrolase